MNVEYVSKKILLQYASRGRWIRTTELLFSYRFEACTRYPPGSSTHSNSAKIDKYIYQLKPWHFYENIVRKIIMHFLFFSTIMVQNHNPQLKWGSLSPPFHCFSLPLKNMYRPSPAIGNYPSHKIIIISPPPLRKWNFKIWKMAWNFMKVSQKVSLSFTKFQQVSQSFKKN